MKKITLILLITALALTMLAGCSDKNPSSPLTPVYANGVAPNYETSETAAPDTAAPDTAAPDTAAPVETSAPEVVTPSEPDDSDKLYSDDHISFSYPSSLVELLPLYLHDSKDGSSVLLYKQAVGSFNNGFKLNAYSDLTVESFAELYTSVISDVEQATMIDIKKSTSNGYEITTVIYYEKNDADVEGAEPSSPRSGVAHVYIENSADPDFDEIIISVSANEYTADTLPEGHVNFTEIVSKIVSTISVK